MQTDGKAAVQITARQPTYPTSHALEDLKSWNSSAHCMMQSSVGPPIATDRNATRSTAIKRRRAHVDTRCFSMAPANGIPRADGGSGTRVLVHTGPVRCNTPLRQIPRTSSRPRGGAKNELEAQRRCRAPSDSGWPAGSMTLHPLGAHWSALRPARCFVQDHRKSQIDPTVKPRHLRVAISCHKSL